MSNFSIKRPDYFHIADKEGKITYGCDQKWYRSKWKQMAGCGPSVATGVFMYLNKAKGLPLPKKADSRTGCVALMDSVWKHITPTVRGVNTTDLMRRGVLGFAAENGITVECFEFPVPKDKHARRDFAEAVKFVTECLEDDTPVAFLNLSNGEIKGLDDWHWMTMVSLETDPGGTGRLMATVYDGPKTAVFDLELWYRTTGVGGGFVRIKYENVQ